MDCSYRSIFTGRALLTCEFDNQLSVKISGTISVVKMIFSNFDDEMEELKAIVALVNNNLQFAKIINLLTLFFAK